jgi:RNA polymerase sigma-70 factor (ECF subfamily)
MPTSSHARRAAPADGAPLSLDDLFREHARTVARWAERFGGPAIDADETVQEVFLTVDRRLHEFRGEGRITTWLFRITLRVVANQRRAARRRRLWAHLTRRVEEQIADPAGGPVETLAAREAASRLYGALDRLPERYRNVLIMFELEELGSADIARLLDRPAATVRVWLHRARAALVHEWRRSSPPKEAP